MSGAAVILRRDCLDYVLIAHAWHIVLVGTRSQLFSYVCCSYFFAGHPAVGWLHPMIFNLGHELE